MERKDLSSVDPAIAAQVDAAWPVTDLGRYVGTYVNVYSGPVITITIDDGVRDPFTQKGRDGMVIIEHERLHVEILRRRWAEAREAFKNVPGRYSSKVCAEIAAHAVDAISQGSEAWAAIENAALDWVKYASSAPKSAAAARTTEQFEKAKTRLSEAEAKLDQLEKDWRANGCRKVVQK